MMPRRTWKKDTQAMLFLATRTLINGIKRSLKSPKRLIGLIFFAVYFFGVLRPVFLTARPRKGEVPPTLFQGIAIPPLEIIEAVVFGLLLIYYLILMGGSFTPSATFKQADVDVLFPTPISTRLVMIFRMVRDTLLSFLLPLIFAIVLFRPTNRMLGEVFKDLPNPASADYVFRAGIIAYLLMAIGVTATCYGLSLWLNRPIPAAARWRKGFIGLYLVIFLGLGAACYFTIWRDGPTGLISLAHSPIVQFTFLPAWAASQVTMAPLNAHWLLGVVGLVTLLGIIGGGLAFALKQTGWFYEITALRAQTTQSARKVQQQGNVYGAYAMRAQQGQYKVRRSKWLGRLAPTRMGGLIWKEAVLGLRTAGMSFVFLGGLALFFSVMAGLVAKDSKRIVEYMPIILLSFTSFLVASNVSQVGFLETLRRVDLLKPLPFPVWKTVLAEVLGKAMIGIVPLILGTIPFLFFVPSAWVSVIGAFLSASTMMVMLCAVYFLMIVLLPDVDDPTQRGFRGIVTLLGTVVFLAPSAGLYVLLLYFDVPGLLAAMPVMALNLCLAALAAWFAGNVYASFNPSE